MASFPVFLVSDSFFSSSTRRSFLTAVFWDPSTLEALLAAGLSFDPDAKFSPGRSSFGRYIPRSCQRFILSANHPTTLLTGSLSWKSVDTHAYIYHVYSVSFSNPKPYSFSFFIPPSCTAAQKKVPRPATLGHPAVLHCSVKCLGLPRHAWSRRRLALQREVPGLAAPPAQVKDLADVGLDVGELGRAQGSGAHVLPPAHPLRPALVHLAQGLVALGAIAVALQIAQPRQQAPGRGMQPRESGAWEEAFSALLRPGAVLLQPLLHTARGLAHVYVAPSQLKDVHLGLVEGCTRRRDGGGDKRLDSLARFF